MPEILKKPNGEVDYSKIFGAMAVAVVLVMQQYQTMHIAEIRTMAEVNKANFMDKQEVLDRVHKAEQKHDELEDRIARLEEKINDNK